VTRGKRKPASRVRQHSRKSRIASWSLRGSRNFAMVAVLLGCGLRRAELAAVTVQDLQQREGHWVFADLISRGSHMRAVPVPSWIEGAVRAWI
jgi:site-specific recombinase XerC